MTNFRYIRDLLRLAGVTRGQLAVAIAAGSVTLISALSLTVLSGWLITRAWEMPPVLELGVAVTAVRALGISRAVFRYLDRLISHKLALGALTKLRSRIFDAIAWDSSGKGRAHMQTRGDGLVRLVSDTDRVTDLIVRTLVPVGVAAVLSLVAVIMAGLLHPLAAVFMVIGFILTGVVTPWLATLASRRGRHVEAEDDLILRIDEALSHRAEFEAAGLGEEHAEATRQASARFSEASVEAESSEALGQGIHTWATGITAAAVLILAVLTYPGEPVWLGMLTMLPLAAFEAHGQLAKAAVHADEASRSARRLVDLTGGQVPAEPVSHDRVALRSPAIVARNLRCQYGEATWDFTLEPGARMVVRGPSGSGKTTLLHTIGGLVPKKSGQLTIGGHDVGDIDDDTLHTTVRVHAEDEWVFATTIAENVRVANPAASDELIDECLAAVGLDTWVATLPDGADTVLADGSGSLSSGQRRRLLLARALSSTAPVLLIDEPTEHLDAESTERILNMLLNQQLPGARAERSVILVTHEETTLPSISMTRGADAVSLSVLPAP